jgi:hypothetical protein
MLETSDDRTTTDELRQGRRRRWFLVLVAVNGVAGWWWTHRGVIDPRLVGRWENVIPSGLPGDITLDAEGKASYIAGYLSFPVYNSACWCVRDHELVLTNARRFDWRINWPALRWNIDLVWGIVGGGSNGVRLRVLGVTDDQLKLELDHPWGARDDGPVATFRRMAVSAE